MKAILIILILVTCCQGLSAQEVVATAGSALSNTNVTIFFPIGEGVENTLSKDDKTITRGIQQTKIMASMVPGLIDLKFSISVYPNPASDVLTLKMTKEDVSGLQYFLFDVNGKLLSQKDLVSNETKIQINQLANGLYILKVQRGRGELKTFKIIKL